MNARPRWWPLVVCACGLAASALLASGCGAGENAARAADPSPLATYRDGEVSFRHPAAWKAYPFRWVGELHFRPSVYLSTQPLQDPCRTQAKTTVCGLPVRRLRPAGVVVVWQVLGVPGVRLGPGRRIRVGGHPAALVSERGGICRSIGADRTIDAKIETSPPPSNFTEVTACLRRPGLAQNARRVDELLASTRFLH